MVFASLLLPRAMAYATAAIALGNDTDTTACVAGGLAGIRHGVDGIPRRWREQLRGQELYAELMQRLVARVDRPG